MCSMRKNELAHGPSADVRENIWRRIADGASADGGLKTNIFVQRVKHTFLEFAAPCELADAHDIHGGRSRAASDDSIVYGEYGCADRLTPGKSILAQSTPWKSTLAQSTLAYAGHATPWKSTLAQSTFGAESDFNGTSSTSYSAGVEECWPTDVELACASVLQETAGMPRRGLKKQAVASHCNVSYERCNDTRPLQDIYGLPNSFQVDQQVGYCNVSNELCNDTTALQDNYGLPISFHVDQQGSKEFQAGKAQAEKEIAVVLNLREQAQDANELAAYFEMQAARLREQVLIAEQFIATESDCNAKLDCNVRSGTWNGDEKLDYNEKWDCKRPWNCDENLKGKCRSSMTKGSTSLPSISEADVDVGSLPESGDVIAAHQRHAKRHHQRRGHFYSASKSSKDNTTLMLRNIPNSYTREALLEHFEEFGLLDCVDFIYVPMDFNRAVGLGYAFVNVASSKDAERAKQMFDGFSSWRTASQKVCEVSFSYPLQGLDAYIEHYRNSCLMHESVPDCCKPALFEGGIRQPFPMPTRQIPLPRIKR